MHDAERDPGHFVDLADDGAAVDAMKNVPWTALQELKGDPNILQKIGDAEDLLRSLRKALS
jgi:ParB family chromosome partitioning protein